jgi:hypothetical protein
VGVRGGGEAAATATDTWHTHMAHPPPPPSHRPPQIDVPQYLREHAHLLAAMGGGGGVEHSEPMPLEGVHGAGDGGMNGGGAHGHHHGGDETHGYHESGATRVRGWEHATPPPPSSSTLHPPRPTLLPAAQTTSLHWWRRWAAPTRPAPPRGAAVSPRH